MSLVSVVVASYNHASFIIRALHSVYSQTWKDVELIVIDDASTDGTLEAANKFLSRQDMRKRFQRIEIIKNDVNLGAPATLNKGLEKASGEWLTILNSDDFYMPERFTRLIQVLTEQNREHGFTGLQLVDKNGTEIKNHRFSSLFASLYDRISNAKSIGFPILDENIAHTSGNIFFSRKIYEKIGGFINLKLSHDWDFLIRLLAIEEPAFVPDPLYCYRLHGNNTFGQVKFSETFDPMIIYARYFRAIKNGNYENPLYPIYRNCENEERLNLFAAETDYYPINYEKITEKLMQHL